MTVTIPSQEELIALGRWWGEGLTGNEILALRGPLGAGKTTFVKGLALGLEIEENIISPTFVLVREYKGKHNLFHFDWYRMDSSKDVVDLGFYDYLDKPGIKVIEWPEKYPGLVPKGSKWISIKPDGANRIVTW